MVSPERVQPHYAEETHSPTEQQNYASLQEKFRNVAYERGDQRPDDRGGRSSGERSEERNSEGRKRLFDGHIIKGIFRRKDNKPPEAKDDGTDKKDEDKDAVKLEKEGGVESLKLPKGFTRGTVEKEDNYMEFAQGKSKDEKVCYWRRGDYNASDDDAKKIADVMKKPPHELTEQETLDLLPCMNPGRWAGNGNFKQQSLRTEDIGGKRVLVGDFKFNDQDKKVHVIIANPDREKHTIEILWHEGNAKDFDANKQAVNDAFKHIKWTDVPNGPNKK